MYRDVWSRKAAAYFRKLGTSDKERVTGAVREICRDPLGASAALKGPLRGLRKRRVGDLRLILEITAAPDGTELGEVFIKVLQPRGGAYKE